MHLPYASPWLLAPMEGVTDRVYRSLVLARNPPDRLGGASTEFVRVVSHPLPVKTLARELRGEASVPVALQLMGSELEPLAATARNAAEAGAPVVDLNFGCPAPGALRGCAGSALLGDPLRLEAVVRACARALEGRVPLTAKIRAGIDDDRSVEVLARAAEAGGASMLTIHCRTRREAYQEDVDWSRIRRAVLAVKIPVCGNGGVREHADLERMRRETGCARVMVGQAALADPWVFSGRRVDAREAAAFLLDYARAMVEESGFSLQGAGKRVKQLVRTWRAGDLIPDEATRRALLREPDAARLLDRLAELGEREAQPSTMRR